MVDPRTAAHTLTQIAANLQLHGANRFKAKAYEAAAAALRGIDTDDVGPMLESGELAAVRGLGPATLAVVRDLVENGQSLYLEQLRTTTPGGLLEILRVPGMTPPKIFRIHEALGIESVDELEQAARDGRLAGMPRYGKKTVDKVLASIALYRARGAQRLYHQALAEGERLRAMVAGHPGVMHARIAGPLRRHCETVGNIDVVAACAGNPIAVAASFTRIGGVAQATAAGSSVEIRFVDGITLRLHCAQAPDFGLALFAATGSTEHVAAVASRLIERGFSIGASGLEREGRSVGTPAEAAVYAHAGMSYVDPALREGTGEIEVAAVDALPRLVSDDDIRGVLHCHTVYSDGRNTIPQMVAGARARGWSYLGITDHSLSAFYAGGMSATAVAAQLEEIDTLNAAAADGFRIFRGIEADILADGRLDYDEATLDRFDFVVGSVHSRFSMTGSAMTERVLRALDDPHLTILGHPTGRLLLSREPYALDVEAVLEKAAAQGIAVELNADPKRLDLDWRHLKQAKTLGARVAIGPDAHSVKGLDNVFTGVGMARKGWITADDVVNCQSADDVLAFARARRQS